MIMWIVRLKYDGPDPWVRTVCGCDTKESADKAGRMISAFYNSKPFCLEMAGVVCMSMFEYYSYEIKEHQGEWK